MIVTIHQPEHLPWLGFFDKMRQADLMVLLDTTQFAKDDFQNRNRIKTDQGATWLTVPVYKRGRSQQEILEVEICNDRRWSNRSWSLIERSYRDAPHFAEHQDFFRSLYAREWTKLVDLNLLVIEYLAGQLGIRTPLVRASQLGIHERGPTEVNHEISRLLGADHYLSGRMGREYLDETPFEDSGIGVLYQDFQHPVYPQLWGGDFVPHLSCLDLLFNCGETSLEVIRGANEGSVEDRSGAAA